jgi:hypothetical protein
VDAVSCGFAGGKWVGVVIAECGMLKELKELKELKTVEP